jgi:hypothetical protein
MEAALFRFLSLRKSRLRASYWLCMGAAPKTRAALGANRLLLSLLVMATTAGIAAFHRGDFLKWRVAA